MNRAHTLSFWERESFFSNIDIAIIGSGIVGISAALSLRERNPSAQIAIFERSPIAEGASTRNAGFACFGSPTELLDDLKTQSESEVFDLVERRYSGLEKLRARIGDVHLKYEARGGYEVFKKEETFVLNDCLENLDFLNKNIAKIVGKPDCYQIRPNDFGFSGVCPQLIWNSEEGQIDTGSLMKTLIHRAAEANIRIFNGIEILSFEENTTFVELETAQGWRLKTDKLLLATNGFAQRLLPKLAVQPARNLVLVTKPLVNLPFKGCFHYDRGYFYFRNIGDNRVLLGGGRNLDTEAESTDDFGVNTDIQNHLLHLLETLILPQQNAQPDIWWSGILGVGPQKKPIVEKISDRLFVAVRMGGMGVAIGTLVGEEAAQCMLGNAQ
jgi:gamma-glutamylputrescine oxidase